MLAAEVVRVFGHLRLERIADEERGNAGEHDHARLGESFTRNAAVGIFGNQLLLTGCDQQDDLEVPQIDLSEVELPNVNWDEYAPELREEVEGLVENADCDGLRGELDGADPDWTGPTS